MQIGATADGRLSGMTFDGDFNTGAYASWGPTVANRVPVHASGPYRVPDYRARSRAVIHTHCLPAGAFRGFGVPQSAIAQESLFDELADKLGMDALEFRMLNALDNGVPTVCGQVFDRASASRPVSRRCAPPGPPPRPTAPPSTPRTPPANAGSASRRAGMAAAIPRCPTPRPSTPGSAPTARSCCIRARWTSGRAPTRSSRRSSPAPSACRSSA